MTRHADRDHSEAYWPPAAAAAYDEPVPYVPTEPKTVTCPEPDCDISLISGPLPFRLQHLGAGQHRIVGKATDALQRMVTNGDCARGCLLWGQHAPDCTDHDTCDGCLPRTAEIGHYCQRCAFKLRDDINAIPPLIQGMYAMPGGQLAPPDRPNNGDPTRRPTKVDQLSPSPALDTADEAARWLHSWATSLANLIAERGPFEYRPNGIPEPNPITEARYLTSRLAHLCAHPAVNDLTDEARSLVHQLTRTTGRDQADQRIPTPCPNCERRTLIRPNGEDYVQCRNTKCGHAWSSDHLGLLAREATA